MECCFHVQTDCTNSENLGLLLNTAALSAENSTPTTPAIQAAPSWKLNADRCECVGPVRVIWFTRPNYTTVCLFSFGCWLAKDVVQFICFRFSRCNFLFLRSIVDAHTVLGLVLVVGSPFISQSK